VHWSPDGHRLAYVHVQGTPKGLLGSVESCDLNGGTRTVVVPDDAGLPVRDFCWLTNQRIIYSRQESSTEDNTNNLWQIGVDSSAGRPSTKPKPITRWAGSQLVGLSASRDGKRLVLRKESSQSQVYLGELTSGGTRISVSRPLTNGESGDEPLAWTADSKAVLFMSYRNGKYDLLKQGISQDTAETLVTGSQSAFLPRLSPDGAWIIYGSWPSENLDFSSPIKLMRIPVNGGLPQFVLDGQRWHDWQCSRAPANVCVILESTKDRSGLGLTAFDPLKGRGKLVRSIEKYPQELAYADGLSPDGATFAIAGRAQPEIHIRFLSLSGGPDREITVRGWGNITGLDWSSDGKGMYCGSVSSQGGTLLYVDLNGRAQALWQQRGVASNRAMHAIPSPDGQYLAIRGATVNSNVWMIEGF
jgi:Tol biopolymer transport system component